MFSVLYLFFRCFVSHALAATTAWRCGSPTWSSTSRSRSTSPRPRPSLRSEWSTWRLTSPWKTKFIAKDIISMTSNSDLGLMRHKKPSGCCKTCLIVLICPQVPESEDEVDGVWRLGVRGVLLWGHHLHEHLLQELHFHRQFVLQHR